MIKGIPLTKVRPNLHLDENTDLYFIIEHTNDEQFLAYLAHKSLDTSCRVFNFFGKYAGIGERTFDTVDIERG